MARTGVAVVMAILTASVAAGQSVPPFLWKLTDQLRYVFPQASAFSDREGTPPHFKAYADDLRTGTRSLIGVAFWTTDVQPLERGYDGPIKVLVGMDVSGRLTRILVVDHHEPYGSFSVDAPTFAGQFEGKSIRDAFRIGSDVDAVSRATITMTSAARVIRNSARQVARDLSQSEVR